MANLASYTTLVQTEAGDTSSRAKSVIEQAIKDAYQEILNFTAEYLVGTTEESVTATVDQRYVDTANVYQDIKSVLYKSATSDTYRKLGRSSEEDYYQFGVNRDSSTPLSWYLNGLKVTFDAPCIDAGTVKVSGIVITEELTGTTVSVIPDRFSQVLVKGAMAHFKAYEGVQDAREYFKIYRGPYFEQGKVGGSLKWMMDQLNTRQKPLRIKLR